MYNISLQGNRVLELVPMQGAPTPTRVRFALRPASEGRVTVHLEQVSPTGATWRDDMRAPVGRWCALYLGATLAPGGPAEPATQREAEQGELGIRTPPPRGEAARC